MLSDNLLYLGLESVDSFDCRGGFFFAAMKYEEVYQSYEEQAQRLLDCGLVADKVTLVQRLRDVGYYRLEPYMAPFRIYDATGHITERFVPGATLEQVWEHYLFDRQQQDVEFCLLRESP